MSEPEPPFEAGDETPPVSAEDSGDPRLGPGDDGEARRYPSTIGGAFYLAVLAVVGIALGLVATGSWRGGIRWFGGALVFAAVVRALLPARDAGMLAVRARWWDCVLLAGTGAAILFLAGSIPDQPL